MRYCPYCGSQITEKDKFCGICGKDLSFLYKSEISDNTQQSQNPQSNPYQYYPYQYNPYQYNQYYQYQYNPYYSYQYYRPFSLFGVIGIICGVIGVCLGWFNLIIGVVFGVFAIVIGGIALTNNDKIGAGAVLLGILSLVITFVFIFPWYEEFLV